MLKTAKILIGAALAAFIATPALAQTISGCVDNSRSTLYNIREGATPSEPCKAGDSLVGWNKEGPRGEKGAPGTSSPRLENTRIIILHRGIKGGGPIVYRYKIRSTETPE